MWDYSAREILEKFEDLWLNWAGAPQEVYFDPGSEFVSEEWNLKMQELGCKTHVSAGDSHWQLGRAEVHGYTIKRMLTRMDLEVQIGSSLDFKQALRQAFAAKNTLCRADGYTPQQSVLGVANRARERARRAFIREDSSASFRRAILRRTRPQGWIGSLRAVLE